IYDYLLTLHLEVKLIWRSKWTVVRLLYHVVRFIPFVSIILILSMGLEVSMELCESTLSLGASFSEVAFVRMLAVILTLRIWAIWDRNRYLGYALPAFFISLWAFATVNMCLLMASIKCELLRDNPIHMLQY
ncbi:hypothetical protein AMATHDRAFT_147036, partial [Amanita thiersii Skay4041]